MFGKKTQVTNNTVPVRQAEPKLAESKSGPRLMGVDKEKLLANLSKGLDQANERVILIREEIDRLHRELDQSVISAAGLESAIATIQSYDEPGRPVGGHLAPAPELAPEPVSRRGHSFGELNKHLEQMSRELS